ncbi:MAG: hypothetical protein IJV76_12205 [Clostridia bacterium]|nr:hypothetical protein [Clostridia bacterium]
MNVETERKYLIKYPDLAYLRTLDGCRVFEMRQTYLDRLPDEPQTERRVRTITENGVTSYVYTKKSPRAYLSRFEDEREVTREEYECLRKDAHSELIKTRYAFPFAGHVMEIDVYPPEIGGEIFEGYAILEVEMSDPDETVEFPDYLEIVREVTDDRRYHNKTLAKKLK